MSEQYKFMKRISELYSTLEDELSRKLFWARMQYDVEPSVESAIQFYGLAANLSKEELELNYRWKDMFSEIRLNGNKLYLYGAGVCGRGTAELILKAGGDFYGFCDRNAKKYQKGFCGKRVYSPEEAFAEANKAYFVITTIDYYKEIFDILVRNGIKESHIIPFLGNEEFVNVWNKQYFEYFDLFERGTAFVDGGCYDCADCLRFAKQCDNQYSKIFAFEPDVKNYEVCKHVSAEKGISDLELIRAGLGKENTTVLFAAAGGTESHTIDKSAVDNRNFDYVDLASVPMEEISIQALDNVVGETKVGFIKLDIEGEEYNALVGAKETLLRDKPFLAICLYHKQGDMLAVMDYLHQLVPEYHFCLRHYSTLSYDTILYASVKEFSD